LAVLVLALAATWVVLVFGQALNEADAVEEQAAAARAENAALRARLEAGREEVAIIQGDEFVRLQARAYGLGERGERVFALRPGAPDPEPIVPLGAAASPALPQTPLDDWLDLLFGSGQRGVAGPPGADGAPED
jgi:cell division protein FtsB